MERGIDILLGAWALVDLLQLPLIAAVLLAWRLTRTFGRAWKATAVAFGGYAAWTIATARLVPFAPSGFLLLVIGTFLAPWRGATPESAWIVGSAVAIVIFWVVPVAIVWSARRRPPPSRGSPAP
ncbi:MAG TPA: hypothetical protein VIV57_16795 [Anaeromyxobacter sp.]